MQITRQKRNSERRLCVTLARHERQTMATEIINKIKRQKGSLEHAKKFGVYVRYEKNKGSFEFLYILPKEKFLTTSELQKLDGVGVQVAKSIANMASVHIQYVAQVSEKDAIKPGADGFYSPRINN